MNNDLISREALKEAINNIVDEEIEIDEKWAKGLKYSFKIIDNAPTVDAYPFEQVQELIKLNQQFAQEIEKLKRPQGEWVKNEGRDLRDCFYTCSKCGRNINVICGETLADYPFCHCGADMRGRLV